MNSKKTYGKPTKLLPEQERRINNGVEMYDAYLQNGKQGIHDRLEKLKLEKAGIQDQSSTENPN